MGFDVAADAYDRFGVETAQSTDITNERKISASNALARLVKRVARLYFGQSLRFRSAAEMLPEYAIAARALGVEIFTVEVGGPEDMPAAFRELARGGGVGLMIGSIRRSLPGMEARWDALMEQIARYRVPAIYEIPLAADEGGMMGYGENVPERLDRLTHESMPRVVVAFPDCFTKLYGNQYLNSIGVGRYADYLCEEIAPFVEAKFNCGGQGKR